MNHLTLPIHRDYSRFVLTREHEFSDSKIQGGHTALGGFFTSVYSWHSFNGGLGGDTFGCAGGLVYRFANPVQFRLPHLAMRRGLTAIQGASHV
jgi:hypothetical protein